MSRVPIIRPTLPPLADVVAALEPGWREGTVTVGPLTAALETAVAARTAARSAIALSSCTAGLMLLPRALDLPPGGEVVVPAFTFAATAQALLWNGLVPVFADCLPDTLTLDPEDVARNLGRDTVAICPAAVYGLPPDVDELVAIGRRAGVPVYFDSAQALGATFRGTPSGGFGVAEVFSASPTKVVTTIEGGFATTNDERLGARLRALRDYGKDPDGGEEMLDLGLSARMSELHAAVGLASMSRIDELVDARRCRIERYRERLGALPGCRLQRIPADRTSSGNYFVLLVGPGARCDRNGLAHTLAARGIQSKRYFHPPLHRHAVFARHRSRRSATLVESERASAEVLALPLFAHMDDADLETVCRAVEDVLA